MSHHGGFWPNEQPNDNFEEQDITMASAYRRGAPVAQYGQHFPSDYDPQLDRMESRSFPGYPDQYLSSDSVLDGSSGRFLASPNREAGMDPDPLKRFYEQPAPWSAHGLNPYSATAPRFKAPQNQVVTRPPAVFPGHREPAKSNPESHLTNRYPTDSGYATNNPGPRSVISNGRDYMEPGDDNASLNQGVHGMQLDRTGSPNPSYYQDDAQVETATNVESWNSDGNVNGQVNLVCPINPCNVDPKPKNPSEYKKHMQRHNKPFVCDVHDCARVSKGFTTKNDLDRHKKSVHKIYPQNSNDRSWICQGTNCNKKGKVWPRLDNFKSHCNRMHKNDDLEELVKKSEVGPDEAGSAQGFANVQPGLGRKQGMGGDCSDDADLLLRFSKGAPTPLLDDLSRRESSYHNASYSQNVSNFPIDTRLTIEGMGPSMVPRTPAHQHRTSLQDPLQPQEGSSTNPDTKLTKPVLGSEGQVRPVQQSRTGKGQISHANPMQELSDKLTSDVSLHLKQLDQKDLDPDRLKMLKSIIEGRLSELIGSKNNKRSSTEAGLTSLDGLSEALRPSKRVYCKTCDKTMPRLCDMKKHEKRHARPWGCTDAECNKSFGSKNDWKRHENSQHYQLEMWRCHEEDPESKIKICAKIFFRRDPFQQHLRRDHKREDADYLRAQLRQRRIGRAFQNTFWCGFCKEIVKLSALGLEAWDERFNHIDDLHFKKGQSIAEWYPMDKDLPKGKLRLQGENPDGPEGLDDHGDESGSDDDDLSPSKKGRKAAPPPPAPPPGPPPSSSSSGPNGSRSKPKPLGTRSDHDTTPLQDRDNWFCNHCRKGPMSRKIDTSCVYCGAYTDD